MMEKENSPTKGKIPVSLKVLILTVVHLLCMAVYLLPILTHPYNDVPPVLDEAHIVSGNDDVEGKSSLGQVIKNDYWGRPMNSESSHKSWRPITILSFRWLQTTWGGKTSLLTTHRIVNILAHAATGECVSILAVNLQEASSQSEWKMFLLRCLVKLLFCLHPTHVEATANAANRSHLFAVLFAVFLCDPKLHIFSVLIAQIIGLMCSETFIFQMPAVVITQILIQFRNNSAVATFHNDAYHDSEKDDQSKDRNYSKEEDQKKKIPDKCSISVFLSSLIKLFPRHLLLFILSLSYLIMRHSLDWLSIPEGLIRPAENPFFPLEGLDRARNYSYILAIHVFKSWNLDFIGFSHEYGFECIKQLEKWSDPRLGVVLFLFGVHGYILRLCFVQKRDQARWGSFLFFMFYLSWMVTLFPVSGIVKVGTFIADRIVIASTVPTCVLVGCYFQEIIMPGQQHFKKAPLIFVMGVLSFMWRRVHLRSLDWMDSHALLLSSLKTCPRSAKSHLEISKVYSGLREDLFDLDKSLHHLQQVQKIDDNYCDVHRQLAHVYIQQQRLLEFEAELAEAILCPFDMVGASDMWSKYWPLVLQDPKTKKEGEKRKRNYEIKISEAIAREQEELKEGKPQWKGARLQRQSKQEL